MLYTKKNTKQTFIKPLQAASAFWSRGFLQIVCSSSCWGTHHGPFDAQLHVAVTPALGVSMSQVLGLCMAFWKPNSDYVLLLTISVFNAEYIIWYNMRLESYLKKCNVRIMKCLHSFICYQSIILETNSRQNCFASSKLPSLLAYGICWHHKLKETNMSCTSTGLQLAFFPLSPMAASETSQQHVAKIRCIGCIGLGPRMYMDIHGCTTYSSNAPLGGKAPS